MPSAVDGASSHLGKVSREIQKAKEAAGMAKVNWIPSEFESIADKIDADDEALSGTSEESMKHYKAYGWPYLVSAGIENHYGLKYIFTMTPLIIKVADSAEFMQCDIT